MLDEGAAGGDVAAHEPVAAECAVTARLDYLALGDWHGTFRLNLDATCAMRPSWKR